MKNRHRLDQCITPRLFRNEILEKLTRVHPMTPLVLFLPLTIYGLTIGFYHQSFFRVISLFVVGIITWTLVEYCIHRFIFHYEPSSPWGQRLHYLLHGVHHDYPSDPKRLVMPPVISLATAVVICFVLISLFGPVHPWPFAAGFALGYIVYDSLHYVLHHFPCRAIKLGAWLKRYHFQHHFRDDRRGFGVSSPLWDYVFGTYPLQQRPPKA